MAPAPAPAAPASTPVASAEPDPAEFPPDATPEDIARLSAYRAAQAAGPRKDDMTNGTFKVGLGYKSYASTDTGHTHEVDPEAGTVTCPECCEAEIKAAEQQRLLDPHAFPVVNVKVTRAFLNDATRAAHKEGISAQDWMGRAVMETFADSLKR